MARLATPPVQLTGTEREQLQQLVNCHNTPQQIVLRARIILLAEEGKNHREISHVLDISRDMARLCRNHWLELSQQPIAVAERLKDAQKPRGLISIRPLLKWLAVCCGTVGLTFVVPVTAISQEYSGDQVLVTQHSDELEELERIFQQIRRLCDQERCDETRNLAESYMTVAEKVMESLGSSPRNNYIAMKIRILGGVYRENQYYPEAAYIYQRGMAIWENIFGSQNMTFVRSANVLAYLYEKQRKRDEALNLYKRSQNILEELLIIGNANPNWKNDNRERLCQSPSHRYSSDRVRRPYRGRNFYRNFYNQPEGQYRQAFGSYFGLANKFNNLADFYLIWKEDYSQARDIYENALHIIEQVCGSDNYHVAKHLDDLAKLYHFQGELDKAEALYKRLLAIWQKEESVQTHLGKIDTVLANLARIYYSKGDLVSALDFLEKALDFEIKNLGYGWLAGMSGAEKNSRLKIIASRAEMAISLHIQDFQNTSRRATHLALTTVFNRKSIVLDSLVSDFNFSLDSSVPENHLLLERLRLARTELSNLIYDPPKELTPEKYHQEIERLRDEINLLEGELSFDRYKSDFPSPRNSEPENLPEPVTIEGIQQFIPDDAALIELVLYKRYDPKISEFGKSHYAAYILKSDGEPEWVDLGEAEPIHKAAFFRFSLDLRHKGDALRQKTEAVKKNARKLDKILMQPIRQKLGDKKHILLSPDGSLNLIPFEALVDENGQYLLENYTFTYLTTGRDLLKLQQNYPNQQPSVIVANPTFNQEGNPTVVANQYDGHRNRSSEISRGTISSFEPLPGTAAEAEAIQAFLDNPQVFTQSQATENVIKNLNSPKVLHIATHGFFLRNLPKATPSASELELRPRTTQESPTVGNPPGSSLVRLPGNPLVRSGLSLARSTQRSSQENPLIRSGLALAGYNLRKSGSEDGVLTALEVAGLNLRGTELVVLSACETGLGEVENGEGVYGLRRAFVIAGAKSSVFSLWKVNDNATKDLMVKYYQRLTQGMGRSEALRQTQLEMLRTHEYQHPYYWAAFILSGDWTPLKN